MNFAVILRGLGVQITDAHISALTDFATRAPAMAQEAWTKLLEMERRNIETHALVKSIHSKLNTGEPVEQEFVRQLALHPTDENDIERMAKGLENFNARQDTHTGEPDRDSSQPAASATGGGGVNANGSAH